MGEYRPRTFSIPRVLLVEPAQESYLCLSEAVRGRAIELIRDQSRSLVERLLECIAEYHGYDPAPLVRIGNWSHDTHDSHSSWSDYLLAIADEAGDRRTGGWRANLNKLPTAALAFDRGMEILSLFAEKWPNRRALIHADLLHGNVLFDYRTGSLGIIDWGSSVYGDPTYELASISYWAYELYLGGNVDFGRRLREAVEVVQRAGSVTMRNFVSYTLHVGLQQLRFNASRGRTNAMRHHARRVSRLSMQASRLSH